MTAGRSSPNAGPERARAAARRRVSTGEALDDLLRPALARAVAAADHRAVAVLEALVTGAPRPVDGAVADLAAVAPFLARRRFSRRALAAAASAVYRGIPADRLEAVLASPGGG